MTPPYRKTYPPLEARRLPPANAPPDAKLPDDDLVFFLIDFVPQLDLSAITPPTRTKPAAPPFDPAMMVCLLLYGYCVGVFSSRKIALACERNLAFLAIVGDERPDFRTISDFRKTPSRSLCRHLFTAGAALGPGSRPGPPGHARHRRHQDGRQCLAAQGHELRLHDQGSRTAAERDRRVGQAGPGHRRRRGRRPGQPAAATNCPRNWPAARTGWRPSRRRKQAAGNRGQAEADAERQRRAEAEAERQRTGPEASGPGTGPDRRDARPQGADELHRSRVEDHEDQQQGLGLLRQRAGGRGRDCQIIVACDVVPAVQRQAASGADGSAALANLEQAGIARPADAQGEVLPIPNLTGQRLLFRRRRLRGLAELGLDPYMATGRQSITPRRRPRPDAAERRRGARDPGAGRSPVTAAKEKMAAKLRTAAGRALYACGRRSWNRCLARSRSAGLSPLPAARPGEDSRRMAVGVPDA